MDERRVGKRTVIVRNGRRYSTCGSHARPAPRKHPVRRAHREALIPGTILAMVLAFAAFVLVNPPTMPQSPQGSAPFANVAHYSFADFANANR